MGHCLSICLSIHPSIHLFSPAYSSSGSHLSWLLSTPKSSAPSFLWKPSHLPEKLISAACIHIHISHCPELNICEGWSMGKPVRLAAQLFLHHSHSIQCSNGTHRHRPKPTFYLASSFIFPSLVNKTPRMRTQHSTQGDVQFDKTAATVTPNVGPILCTSLQKFYVFVSTETPLIAFASKDTDWSGHIRTSPANRMDAF